MSREAFEQLINEEFSNAIPEQFRATIKNVAFLTEDEPSLALRMQERLGPTQTLLGYYHGIPATARGDNYGVGATLPDTITLFQRPIEDEAQFTAHRRNLSLEEALRGVIRDTIWHEVAHHFGYDERQVRAKEATRRAKK